MTTALTFPEALALAPATLRAELDNLDRNPHRRVARRITAALRELGDRTSAHPHAARIIADALNTYRANVAAEATRTRAPKTPGPAPTPAARRPPRRATPLPTAPYFLPCTCGGWLPARSPRPAHVNCTHDRDAVG